MSGIMTIPQVVAPIAASTTPSDPWAMALPQMRRIMRIGGSREAKKIQLDRIYTDIGNNFADFGRPIMRLSQSIATLALQQINDPGIKTAARNWPMLPLVEQCACIGTIFHRWRQVLPLSRIRLKIEPQPRQDRAASYNDNFLHPDHALVTFYGSAPTTPWRTKFLHMLELAAHEVLGHGIQHQLQIEPRRRFSDLPLQDWPALQSDIDIIFINLEHYIHPPPPRSPLLNAAGVGIGQRAQELGPYFRQPAEQHARKMGYLMHDLWENANAR